MFQRINHPTSSRMHNFHKLSSVNLHSDIKLQSSKWTKKVSKSHAFISNNKSKWIATHLQVFLRSFTRWEETKLTRFCRRTAWPAGDIVCKSDSICILVRRVGVAHCSVRGELLFPSWTYKESFPDNILYIKSLHYIWNNLIQIKSNCFVVLPTTS